MPMLALVNTSCPRTSNGVGQLLLDALGDAGGVRLASVMSSSRTVNSSPPSRASVSPGRMQLLEPPRDADQELVAGLVAEAVVDRLEAIEIEVQHREQRPAQRAPRAVKQVLQAVEEQRAVRQAGERIVERLALELRLGLLALGDVARDAERADDVPPPIAQRQLGGRDPADVAVRPGLLLLDVHQRLAGADDLLLVAAAPCAACSSAKKSKSVRPTASAGSATPKRAAA